jgi:peroxiredoxin
MGVEWFHETCSHLFSTEVHIMLTPGTMAPDLDLELNTIDGERTSLRALANGNSLLLILLKTSCKSCKIGLPFASRLQQMVGDAPLTIVAVSQDSANVTRSFKRRSEVDLPFLLDADPFPMSQSYEIEATPSWFLIGPDGEIKQTALGVFHQPLNQLLESIAELVPGAPRLLYSDIDPELPAFVPACPSKHLEPVFRS